MRLTVIGCAAAWGHGQAAASSCYLVESGSTAICLDLGQGSFALLSALIAPERLAAILVSHAHSDHCIDLIALRHYLRYEAGAAGGTVALHGPRELPQRFDAFTNEAGFLADLAFAALAPGDARIGSLDVTVAKVRHTQDSYAFRVAAPGASSGLVYSGDCGEARDLVALLHPGDTLLCEAYFGAGPPVAGVAHLDAAAAARAARDGGATRLVLTHLHPALDPKPALAAAASVFQGVIALARPGMILEHSSGD